MYTRVNSVEREMNSPYGWVNSSGTANDIIVGPPAYTTKIHGTSTIVDSTSTTATTLQPYFDLNRTVGTSLDRYIGEKMTTQTLHAIETEIRDSIRGTNYSNAYITDLQVEPNYESGSVNVHWTGIYDNNSAGVYEWPQLDKKQQKQKELKNNLLIKVKTRADELLKNLPENEQVAIETLREEISETEYRRYMKYGFITVVGGSGDRYQIFRNRSHTRIWRGGKIIEEVCVRLSDSKMPPTDSVVAFKNMIQINEKEFKKLGNVYNMRKAA